MKILITPAEACVAWEDLAGEFASNVKIHLTHGQVDDSASLSKLLEENDGVILGLEPINGEVLGSSDTLKIVSRFGVGYDAVDLGALKERGIRLSNTPGCQYAAVARQTIAFLLAITFNLPEHGRRLKTGEWARSSNRSCEETVLGIAGMGGIGREVASLAVGLGFPVIGYNRSPFSIENVATAESIKDLVRRSDVVSIHLPLNSETRGLFSSEVLNWLEGKSLINTARGGIASEEDVLQALTRGTLQYYASDVFEVEPIGGISRELVEHPRVISTPHVAAMDPATARRMVRQAYNNIRHCLAGEHEMVNSYVL